VKYISWSAGVVASNKPTRGASRQSKLIHIRVRFYQSRLQQIYTASALHIY